MPTFNKSAKKNPWRAIVWERKAQTYLGSYPTKEEAISVEDEYRAAKDNADPDECAVFLQIDDLALMRAWV